MTLAGPTKGEIMPDYFELDVGDGKSIRVEIEPKEGLIDAGFNPGELAERARYSFENMLETAHLTAKVFIAKVRDFNDPPDEVELEFGLKLDAAAGVLVAQASTEAHFVVTLTWKHPT
jgi:hypothetical protein